MAINKADILTAVVGRLNRTNEVTDIDTELLAVMKEVSSRVRGALQKEDTVTIAAGGSNIALPTDCIRIGTVSDPESLVLRKAPYHEIKVLLGADAATAASILKWAVFKKNIYVHPKPIGETVLTLFFEYEDDDVDSITLDDCFLECLTEGVCHKIELGKGTLGNITEGAITHKTFYEEQVAILIARYAERAI